MSEFIAYAKTRPDKLNFASSSPGTVQHLSGEHQERWPGTDIFRKSA